VNPCPFKALGIFKAVGILKALGVHQHCVFSSILAGAEMESVPVFLCNFSETFYEFVEN
jgi:hypothetical protein